MAPARGTKKENKEQIEDGETAVFWLKKIYMKMETIETNLEENNRTIKKQSDSLILLFEEINNLKRHVCLGDDIENKGMRMQDETKNSHINNYNLQKIINSRKLNYYNKIRCDGIASINLQEFSRKRTAFYPAKISRGSYEQHVRATTK